MSKLISRFEIGLDNDAKATINDLKAKIDGLAHELSAKNDTHADRLLAAMQADAANDEPQPELKELGQWVFEGCDPKWVSAVIHPDGQASRCNFPAKSLMPGKWGGWIPNHFLRLEFDPIDGCFDATNWKDSAIDRETVNDVDYLSETSEINVMEASDIIIDEMGRDYSHTSNCLSAVVPQITQADMQLIFIKNLSECLIQRMHSMDRFSEDDYHIGGANLMPWDIVTGEYNDNVVYGVVAGTQVQADRDTNKIDIVRLKPKFLISENHVSIGAITSIYFDSNDSFCTVTEAELPAFRAALEACYA